MKREDAEKIKEISLAAIRNLNSLIEIVESSDPELKKELRRGIGLSIGEIDISILCIIYKIFPDMDDIK